MTTCSDGSYDLSKTSRKEFNMLFEFASTYDMSISCQNIEPAQSAFIDVLSLSFQQWRIDNAAHLDVMPSIQYVLGFEQLQSGNRYEEKS